MKKAFGYFLLLWLMVILTACSMVAPSGKSDSKESSVPGKSEKSDIPVDEKSEVAPAPSKKDEVSYEITDTIFSIEDSFLGNGKGFNLIIELKNIGTAAMYLEDCKIDFEDDEGHLLQTYDFLSKTPDIVEPGEKGYFYVSGTPSFDEDVDLNGGCNLVPQISIEKAKGEMQFYEVTDTSIYKSYDSVGCRGRVINDTNEDIDLIMISIIYYDKEGRVLGISFTTLSDVKAQGKGSFDDSGLLMAGGNFKVDDVADYKIYASEMYYQF